VGRVAGASLNGELVGGVLSSIASDSLETAVVASEGNVEPNNTLACLDEVKVLLGDAGLLGSLSVEKLDLLEETGLSMLIETGAVFVARCGIGRRSKVGLRAGEDLSSFH